MEEKYQQQHITQVSHFLPEALCTHDTRLDIEHALADPKARIPPHLDSYYYDYQNCHQRHYLRQVNLIGQLAFMMYFFADYFILEDVTLLSGLIRFTIISIAIITNYYLFKYVQDIRVLDLILPIGSLICVTAWLFILSQSQSDYVVTYIYASFIFILLANLSIQVSFRPILYISLFITAVISVGAFYLLNPISAVVYLLAYIPILLFSLFISATTTLNARRHFLRTLMDNWTYHSLQHLAHTDELTQLSNRREFLDRAELEVKQWPKHCSTCLFMFDVDHFKHINDNYGHDVGDIVLKHIALISRKEMRRKDILARFGGEEFVALLSESSLEETFIIAERLRERIAKHEITLETGQKVNFTVSIGIASLQPEDNDLNVLIKQADIALYSAKESGRNKVVVYDPSMPEHSETLTKQVTSWVI
jgi:diguanylate cyclase (GGDEF)-like protein